MTNIIVVTNTVAVGPMSDFAHTSPICFTIIIVFVILMGIISLKYI